MFAIASFLTGLQAVSSKDFVVTQVLEELVTKGHAPEPDTAARLLIDWLAGQLCRDEQPLHRRARGTRALSPSGAARQWLYAQVNLAELAGAACE